ncbi:MAG: hypothetical protein AAF530_08980 [Pseudomonadota bacterium]
MMRCKLILALIPLGLAAGCGPPSFAVPAGPKNFQVGYLDGCDAGYAYAGSPLYTYEEPSPPEQEGEYRAGWTSGFKECKDNYDHFQDTLNHLFGPPTG